MDYNFNSTLHCTRSNVSSIMEFVSSGMLDEARTFGMLEAVCCSRPRSPHIIRVHVLANADMQREEGCGERLKLGNTR